MGRGAVWLDHERWSFSFEGMYVYYVFVMASKYPKDVRFLFYAHGVLGRYALGFVFSFRFVL